MLSVDNDCALSIDLLPEFGWSIKNTPIYGPGSVFQGSVKLKITSQKLFVSRVCLAFVASEKIPSFELSPGVIRSSRHPLFNVRTVLWESKCPSMTLDVNKDYSFPFTLQMPMVQYPPSVEDTVYECSNLLMAIIDTPESLSKTAMPLKIDIPLTYMPFIETSMMKSPFMLEAQKSHLKAQLSMGSLAYLPNDTIYAKMNITRSMIKKKPNSTSLQYVTVNLKLVQTINVKEFKEIANQVKTITRISHKLPLVYFNQQNETLSTDTEIQLKVPADTTPSCDYSKLVDISYELQVSVEQKGPLGGIWNYIVNIDPIPITIGTLGYGIKNSTELRLYSNIEENSITPRFMKTIEYEDALPLYDPAILPSYNSSSPMILGQ